MSKNNTKRTAQQKHKGCDRQSQEEKSQEYLTGREIGKMAVKAAVAVAVAVAAEKAIAGRLG